MLKKLVKIANRLDDFGLTKEADVIDAVIQKMAQVEGVPGAKYQGGRQVSVNPGGPTVKFYASKPESIRKLNELLENLVSAFGHDELEMRGKKVFPDDLIKNPPKASDSTWTKSTEQAFDAFAEAAGYSEAGQDWVSFAKANEYAPSVDGIIAFVEDHIAEVTEDFTRLRDTFARLSSPSEPGSANQRALVSPQEQLAETIKMERGQTAKPTLKATPGPTDGQSITTKVDAPLLSANITAPGLQALRINEPEMLRRDLVRSIIKDKNLNPAQKERDLNNLGYTLVTENGVQKAVKIK